MWNDLLIYRKVLRKNNQFATKARLELFRAFRGPDALTVAQVIKLTPRQNAASVYRNLELFEHLGIVTRVKLGNQTKFELSELFRQHHHHLFCTTCGQTFKLTETPALENELKTLSQINNFHPSYHQLEIMGTCDYCYVNRVPAKTKRPGAE